MPSSVWQVVMQLQPLPPQLRAWLEQEGHKDSSIFRDLAVNRAYKVPGSSAAVRSSAGEGGLEGSAELTVPTVLAARTGRCLSPQRMTRL